VLAVEDLQWADPTWIDVLRALSEQGAQAPIFIVATTRPEFRPPWSMRSHHSVLSLAPLDPAEVLRMIGELASRHALSKDVVQGVSERTAGVPLFVEEVTRLLLEKGEQGGAQTIPPTLQLSLAARLDRLGEAREIAQIGAVLGRGFSYALLAAVAALDDRGLPPPPRSRAVPLPRSAGEERGAAGWRILPRIAGEGDHAEHGGGGYADPAIQSALQRLVDADIQFVERLPSQANYRFKHALIQDASQEPPAGAAPPRCRNSCQRTRKRGGRAGSDRPSFHSSRPRRRRHRMVGQGGRPGLAFKRRSPVSARRSKLRIGRPAGRQRIPRASGGNCTSRTATR
jgi:hypothetical protein